MKALLTKRLFRSLWRSKIRLVAVVLIIMVGVMSGIAFGHYAHMTTNMYSEIYEDSENGVNLADIWVENPRDIWDLEESENLCEEISLQWANSQLPMVECEPRLVLEGLLIVQKMMVQSGWCQVFGTVLMRAMSIEFGCLMIPVARAVLLSPMMK